MLLISAFILYGALKGWQGLVLNAPGPDLIKSVLACNAFAAFAAPVIAVFGLNIANRILELVSPQRH